MQPGKRLSQAAKPVPAFAAGFGIAQKPFILPQNSTQTPARTHLCTTKTVDPPAPALPKIPLLTAEKRPGKPLNSKDSPHFGCFFGADEDLGRRLGLLESANLEPGGWQQPPVMAGGRQNWDLHSTWLYSPLDEEEEEDISHVDNNNDSTEASGSVIFAAHSSKQP